ncbi:serine protease inhibitor ecotin [Shewanella schlegeliana]|uniref:Serine protease inhibitor ecotin n=1 Tax=Shewanella schlegeliana TaxID=190308 RepID=A0ABS1SU51_9GAMM|nr:serine protease inhibitor ecotin [Shewanella schlegeliana]MBL4912053.1 serine protease inhibitor ecotin [Shewanella schlegeliana]MCL1111350.1 serine protease inhibitor ecotin [Shewanella schlegeliana]GIU33118.1 ecotin [Shewanella schlegeliana]
MTLFNTGNTRFARTLLASSLILSAFSFNASATSPAHPSGVNQNMISAQMYTVNDYSATEETKMFPAPQAGQVQHILTLPKLDNEADYKVEIQIGQTKMVDCNKHGLNGELKQHSVKGWGYNYYQVDTISEGPSTMMACFDQAKTEKFLPIRDDLMLKYDSRLPKVFYLPENTQVRYRVWKVESPFSYSGEAAK